MKLFRKSEPRYPHFYGDPPRHSTREEAIAEFREKTMPTLRNAPGASRETAFHLCLVDGKWRTIADSVLHQFLRNGSVIDTQPV